MAATLRLAAAQLRDDRMVEERLTQLPALIPVERLISVAALVLEQRAAAGDAVARDAAAHLSAAGLILTMEQRSSGPIDGLARSAGGEIAGPA